MYAPTYGDSSNRFSFFIDDLPERVCVQTLNTIKPNVKGEHTNSYRLIGASTPVVFTNKTITDPTNNIAAKSLIVANTALPIGGAMPAVGEVATWDGSTISFQPGAAPMGPSPFATQMIYVRKGGNDAGTGGLDQPFATIAHAFTQCTSANTNKRYIVDVGPGNWAENLTWPAWVFVRGNFTLATRFTGNHNILHPSWAVPGINLDQRGGAQNINFSIGAFTLDYLAAGSQYGKFYFYSCNINNLLQVTGANPINQLIIEDGLMFGGIVASSVNILWQGVSGQGGTITLNSSTGACSFSGYGGGTIGSLIINHTSDIAPQAVLLDCPVVNSITIVGPGAVLYATNSSLPPRGQITIIGGGTLTRLTDAFSLQYTPNATYWPTPPDNVADAIDQIAVTKPLTTGISSLAAGSVTIPYNIPAGAKVSITVQPGPAPTGQIYCSVINPGVSFTILSTAADNCNVFWQVFV